MSPDLTLAARCVSEGGEEAELASPEPGQPPVSSPPAADSPAAAQGETRTGTPDTPAGSGGRDRGCALNLALPIEAIWNGGAQFTKRVV